MTLQVVIRAIGGHQPNGVPTAIGQQLDRLPPGRPWRGPGRGSRSRPSQVDAVTLVRRQRQRLQQPQPPEPQPRSRPRPREQPGKRRLLVDPLHPRARSDHSSVASLTTNVEY